MLLFFNLFALFAQEEEPVRTLDEVVVTATRASVNRSSVPMTISVVNREEIEESSESALLPALSERVPGMFVTQRGVTGFGVAAGGTGGINMRGVGGSPTTQLLVLIDGHPQYMGIMGHHLPDAYVASDVEKVEVIRGPASILYGSNAMGGAINIITRKQNKEGWSANGRMMYGSHNTQKYMANGGLKKGRFDGFLSVNHDRTDGHRAHNDVPSSQFAITNGYAKFGFQANERLRIWSDLSLASYEAQNPGTLERPMFDNVADILRGVASLTAENSFGKTSGALKLYYNFGQHKINDGYTVGGSPRDFRFRSSDHNYGISLYQLFRPFAGNSITAGVDYKQFGGQARNEFMDDRPDASLLEKTSLHEIAGYAVVQQTLFDKLTLNAGLRLENSEQFGAEWVPQAGLSYRPLRRTVLKAMISKGFRSPSIREMYMFAPQPNPELKPERMVNYELSAGQGFFGGLLTVELNGYIANGSNLIVAPAVTGTGKFENFDDFSNKGIELAVRWKVMKNLDVNGNYSYLNMKKPILNVPQQQAYIAASYRWNRWMLSANYQHIHGLYLTVGDSPTTENYGLLNARVSYRPLKWLDAFVKGENLTDKAYSIVHGYPMPGITVFGGVNLRFGK